MRNNDVDDYIRKAIELADGWNPVPHNCAYVDPDQHDLDAIAAQLVRQVDALDNFWVDSDPHGTAKVWSGSAFGVGDMARIAKANDEDRTMNTIKAIVDSGVL